VLLGNTTHTGREDEGFTLIELMVVLLIIAILLAIAIPTFLGARNTANARGAQEDLRNALTAELTIYSSTQAFSQDTVHALPAAEPSITWITPPGIPVGSDVAVLTDGTSSSQAVVLQAAGKDHNCYAIYETDASTPQTAYMESPGACLSAALPANAPATETLQPGGAINNPNQWSSSW
jgi:type IV pilus assembly protein PilA